MIGTIKIVRPKKHQPMASWEISPSEVPHFEIETFEQPIEYVTELLARIRNKSNKYECDIGHRPEFIVLNDIDFEFICAYFRYYDTFSYGTRDSNGNYTLYGMKVLKMKQKGFIFANE